MKYLSDYTEQEHTKVFNKYNVFFAFSIEQLKEGEKEGQDFFKATKTKKNEKNLMRHLIKFQRMVLSKI